MRTASRVKSVGRFARSVDMMTQRPTMGSFLSSGKRLNPFNTNQNSILRYGEGIPEQLKCRVAGPPIIVYGHYIETPLARRWQMPKVIPGDQGEGMLFFTVHG